MKYKTAGSMRIPDIGLGTWGIGGDHELDDSHEKEEIDLIKNALVAGVEHIDTAEYYGQGQAEKIVGKAIQYSERGKLFLTTKVWKDNLSYEGVISAMERSLQRLGTEYVDLYLVHWPNPDIPLKETMNAMKQLVDMGKAKHIGVSNFSLQQLKEAQQYYTIAAHQIEFNIQHQEPLREMIPFCQKQDIMTIAYKPLGRGRLLDDPRLSALAQKYGVTNAQIALSWLVSQENVVTIPLSRSLVHVKENLKSAELELHKEDILSLTKSS
ncbi:aldo/keto reductase [Candidatus Woesearchaeota archaeon]|nr:aldo/keto reductase [Candidatus Woesearchaeota archaeon]